jgi:hypothetical protein
MFGHGPGRTVNVSALLEPGILVGCEDAERATAQGQHFVAFKDHLVLAQVQRDAGFGQAAPRACLAGQCGGLVVVVGVDGLHAQLPGQRHDLVLGPAVPHDQPGAFHAV